MPIIPTAETARSMAALSAATQKTRLHLWRGVDRNLWPAAMRYSVLVATADVTRSGSTGSEMAARTLALVDFGLSAEAPPQINEAMRSWLLDLFQHHADLPAIWACRVGFVPGKPVLHVVDTVTDEPQTAPENPPGAIAGPGEYLPMVDFAEFLKPPLAIPSCRAQFLMMSGGEAVCRKCAGENAGLIIQAIRKRLASQWLPWQLGVNWEEPDLVCANCGKPLPRECQEGDRG